MMRYIGTVFCCLLCLQAWSQAYPVRIVDPLQGSFCSPGCIEVLVQLDMPGYDWAPAQFRFSPAADIRYQELDPGLYEICTDTASGSYVLIVEALDRLTQTVHADSSYLVFFRSELGMLNILGQSCRPVSEQPGSEQESCWTVCVGSQETYGLDRQVLEGEWEVVGATDYTHNWIDNSITVTWGTAGVGVVKFTAYDRFCMYTVEQCVEVLPQLTAEFNTLPEEINDEVTLCLGQTLYLTNLTQGAQAYVWDFGDGSTSSDLDPEHTYTQPGTYTLTLKAISACPDCADDSSIDIVVEPAPAPQLSCLATLCPGDTMRYDAMTDDCATFHWTISANGTIIDGGGLQDNFIEVIWSQGPDGIISLLVEDCDQPYCSQPALFRVPIISPHGPMTGDPYVCSGEIATYRVPRFDGVTYNWSVTSLGTILTGQNTSSVTIQWAEVDARDDAQVVTVEYDHCYLECGGSTAMNVSIVPHLIIQSDAVFCQDQDATFDAVAGFTSSSPVICDWQVQDQDGQIIWASPSSQSSVTVPMTFDAGVYTMTAFPSAEQDVCEDYVVHIFYIVEQPKPPADILGPIFICPTEPQSYEVKASGQYGTTWVVTDGPNQYTYTGSIIRHVFGSLPPYQIDVAHTDLAHPSCISEYRTISLYGLDSVRIQGADSLCLEEVAAYHIQDYQTAMVEWRIEPADHGEVSNPQALHTEVFWTRSGPAQLVVDVCGAESRFDVFVHTLPELSVEHPPAVCANETATVVEIHDHLHYTWRDSSRIVIGVDVDSLHMSAGYYEVEATDDHGCQDKTAFHIAEWPTPDIRISHPYDNVYCGTMPSVTLYANDQYGTTHYEWYQDGVSVGHDSTNYTTMTPATYHAVATNRYGCSDESNREQFYEWCRPQSGGGVCNADGKGMRDSCLVGTDAWITELSCTERTYTAGTSLAIKPGSERWLVEQPQGGYKIIKGNPISYTHRLPGYYTIYLFSKVDGFTYLPPYVEHLFGMKDTIPAVPDFIYSGVCAGDTFFFIDESQHLPEYTIDGYLWDFGDGHTSMDQDPAHIYSTPGVYIVTLTIQSSSGCVSSILKEVKVNAGPTLEFDLKAQTCEKTPTVFNLHLADRLFDIVWQFDDTSSANNTAMKAMAWHSYDQTGHYFPSVSASDIYGCRDIRSMDIEVRPNMLSGEITSSLGDHLCEGDTTILSASPGGATWNWNSLDTTEVIRAAQSGSYSVLVTDSLGCLYRPDPFELIIDPVPAAIIKGRTVPNGEDVGFWMDSLEICAGEEIELEVFTDRLNAYYQWNNGRTTKKIFFTSDIGLLDIPGSHSFDVVVQDTTTMCYSDTAHYTVVVRESPAPFFVSHMTGTGCSGTTNVLQIVNPQVGMTYVWSDGQVGTRIETDVAGSYYATAYSPYGCSRHAYNEVLIRQGPRVDLVPAGCFISCDRDTICLPDMPDFAFYEIFKDGASIESGSTWPDFFIAEETGTYHIRVDATNGCSDDSEPFFIELYEGYGDIGVYVFMDVNANGIIDPADSILPNLSVKLMDVHGGILIGQTSGAGRARFDRVDNGLYIASIDSTSLADSLIILIDNQPLDVIGCGRLFTDSLLVGLSQHQVWRRDSTLYLCPGDSLWLDGAHLVPGDIVEVVGRGIRVDTITRYTIEQYPDIHHTVDIQEACEGIDNGSVAITAEGGVGTLHITWQGRPDTGFVLQDLPPGEYAYNIVDSHCAVQGIVDIGMKLLPDYSLDIVYPGCESSTGHVSVMTEDDGLMWSTDSIHYSRDPLMDLPPGMMPLFFTDGVCTQVEWIDLPLAPSMDPIEILTHWVVPANVPVQLVHNYLDSVDYEFTWSPAEFVSCSECPAPILTGLEDHVTLHLQVISPYGCVQTVEVLIEVDASDYVYIPNAFSPNNDGTNDVFKPLLREGYATTQELSIYDRWGTRIYQERIIPGATDIIGWNGSSDKSPFGVAIYIYQASILRLDGSVDERVGEVYLIR